MRTTSLMLASGAAGLPTLVLDIGMALVVAGLLASVFTRLRIPTIAAFLLAGVILGPVSGVISDPANIDTIAQLGLILLLFLIGLEIDVRALLAGGRTVITSGLLQYPLTALFGFLAVQGLILAGVASGVLGGTYTAVYLGLAVAASSTLLVAAMFQQTFTLDTLTGRISLALLVFQDIWAIIVLALQPNLESPEIGPILGSFAGIAILAVLARIVARTLLPIGFRWIAKQPATILAASLAWCFAVVIAGVELDDTLHSLFGLDLGLAVSAGMGALIAGITVANLPFSGEIARQVSVVRDFFVTLFFVGIGMTIPAPDDVAVIVVAVVLALIAILSRYGIMLPLLYVTGLDRQNAALTSTKLVPISEFSLVIAFIGLQLGHIDEQANAAIVFAFVLTAVVSPAMFTRADRIYDRIAPLLQRIGLRTPPAGQGDEAAEYDLALLGVHRTGSSLLHELSVADPELLSRTLVVDFNVAIHPAIAALGPHVVYGDLTSPETMRHAGVDRARVVLCTIPGDVLVSASTRDVVASVRDLAPHAVVIATATTFPEVRTLYAAGADYVLMPRLDAAQSALAAVRAALLGHIGEIREKAEHDRRREVLD